MYGTQTKLTLDEIREAFENDVNMYGTQTGDGLVSVDRSLRMM